MTSAAGSISAQWNGRGHGEHHGAPARPCPWRSRWRAPPPPCARRRPPGRCALSLATSQTSSSLAASRDHLLRARQVEPEQRRHGADALRDGLLHGVAAQPEEPRRVADREAAGRGKRGIFAERMAGHIGGALGDATRPRSSAPRCAAKLTAISAGWALRVRVSASSGPSKMVLESRSPSASSTSSNTARAAGTPSASALPMPTAWLPWPGKRNAVVIGPPIVLVDPHRRPVGVKRRAARFGATWICPQTVENPAKTL